MSTKKVIAALSAVMLVSSLSVAHGAAAQKFTFKLIGKCVDSAIEGTIEEDVTQNCRIATTLNPAKPFRVINLQYKDEAGAWQFANDDSGDKINAKSDSGKRVEVDVPTVDEDGVFFDFPSREYRIYIAKNGANPAVASKIFTINYKQAGGAGDAVDSGTATTP